MGNTIFIKTPVTTSNVEVIHLLISDHEPRKSIYHRPVLNRIALHLKLAPQEHCKCLLCELMKNCIIGYVIHFIPHKYMCADFTCSMLKKETNI